MSIGKNISRLRRQSKRTQQQISRRTGLAISYISRVENDRLIPTIPSLINITKALGVMSSRTLGDSPILVAITRRRSGKKMNVFFCTDLQMDPTRLLEIYAARFKIEDAFDELKTHGGFADCRQRSHRALKRHATLCLVSYSLLRLLSLTLKGAESLEAEPWWRPTGPPSVTRMRRALARTFAISPSLLAIRKPNEIQPVRKAA